MYLNKLLRRNERYTHPIMSTVTQTTPKLGPSPTSRKAWDRSKKRIRFKALCERNSVTWQTIRTVSFRNTQLRSSVGLGSKIGRVLCQILTIKPRLKCSRNKKSLKQLWTSQFQISSQRTSNQTLIPHCSRSETKVQLVCLCSQICSSWNNRSFNKEDASKNDLSHRLTQPNWMGLVLSQLNTDLTWMN